MDLFPSSQIPQPRGWVAFGVNDCRNENCRAIFVNTEHNVVGKFLEFYLSETRALLDQTKGLGAFGQLFQSAIQTFHKSFECCNGFPLHTNQVPP